MSRNTRRILAAVAAVAASAVVLTAVPASGYVSPDGGAATAPANSVTTTSIVNGTILQQDVNANVVKVFRTPTAASVWSYTLNSNIVTEPKLSPEVRDKLNSTAGQVSKVESDGPYPGATDLGSLPEQGDNSDALVPNDGHIHTVWVQCAPGKIAMGGGFRVAADATEAAQLAVQVVASEPAQVKDGALVNEPIEDDPADSILANGWRVDAANNGTAAVVVRPWVTCLKVG